ncbi:Dermonecrotic toxin [Pseudomonas sp. IT-347P]
MHLNPGAANSLIAGSNPSPGVAITSLSDAAVPHSSVMVSALPDPIAAMAESNLKAITLPPEQTHFLHPSTTVDGLFSNPLGHLYARLDDGVYYRAEVNANGDVEIPWPSAPGVSAPLLRKIEGRPVWRVEADWYARESGAGARTATVVESVPTHASAFLAPHLAALLTNPQNTPEGIRYDKRKKTYVDMAEGTVMVGRNSEGHFQQTIAGELTPSGFLVEHIPGTKLWRRRSGGDSSENPGQENRRPAAPNESPQGPSKRARRGEEVESPAPVVQPQPTGHWQTWGHAAKPQTGDSLEIDGRHYPIIEQQGYTHDSLIFLKPPQFSASRFDAFEQLLTTVPDLQPRGAVRIRDSWASSLNDTWRVIDGLPFKQPLTQYVSDKYPYLADHSARKIVHAMFNRANHGEALNGYGLNDLFETFQFWGNRPKNMGNQQLSRPDLVDPLVLLPALARTGERQFPKPLSSAEGLERIDFDLQRLPQEWRKIGDSYTTNELRAVFEHVLRHQGYQVSTSFRAFAAQRDALMIRQQGVDQVFIMLFPSLMQGHYLDFDSKTWLRSKALVNKHEPSDKVLLTKALGENKVVYLMGDIDRDPAGQTHLFVFRQK